MATSQYTAQYQTTAADFVSYFKPVSDFLTSCGIQKTTDTGQWDGVTPPASTAETYVYEVRTFTDSTQTNFPVFMKIRYGQGTANTPKIGITLGTGSNGSGTITAPTGVTEYFVTQNSAITSAPCLISGNNNSFRICFSYTTVYAWYLSVERGRDSAGNIDGNLVFMTRHGAIPGSGGNSPGWNTLYNRLSGVTLDYSGLMFPGVATSGGDGNILNTYNNLFFRGGTPLFGLNTIGYYNLDFPRGTPFTTSIYGTNRTYFPIGGVENNNGIFNVGRGFQGNAANSRIAMLWE